MAVDPRQVLGAALTLSMFAMLGNMIKKDHFDTIQYRIKIEAQELVVLPKASQGPWKESSAELKPCWTKPGVKEAAQAEGFVTFSLTTGPEYHISQVADALVITRYLGATLVLPDIRGSDLGQKWNFEDMYDVDKFMKSLDGVIKIVKELPAELAAEKPAVVKVPNRLSEEFIVKNIEPIFRTKSYLRLASFFPSINMRLMQKQSSDADSTACLAMFGSLELKPDIRAVATMMVERLRTLSHKSEGHFIAVDLRVDVLEKRRCKESGSKGMKSCYSAQEIAEFLRKIGFDGDTVIYLTQSWWHESLNTLKEFFPKIYTKDDIIPADMKGNFLKSGSAELRRALDFHICTHSDVFVPAISGLFYGNVAGKRIASGRTQILVPAQIPGSAASASDFISPYVSRKNHLAYSCYC